MFSNDGAIFWMNFVLGLFGGLNNMLVGLFVAGSVIATLFYFLGQRGK